MTRNGKIARLPRAVRTQLNGRLGNGEPGPELLDWLNGLPEVRKVIQSQFDGTPISKQNLSEWRPNTAWNQASSEPVLKLGVGLFSRKRPGGEAQRGSIPARGAVTEAQRSQRAFCAKTLRAAGLLPVACVDSFLTARCGDARNSSPWPQPKSSAAGPLLISKQALSQGIDASQTQSDPVKRKSRRRGKSEPIPDGKGGQEQAEA
jgi:hypothetical protein